MPGTSVIEFDGRAIELRAEALSRILADSVAAGAAISFMSPLSYDAAEQFWLRMSGLKCWPGGEFSSAPNEMAN